jgi:hypothetical protein
MIDAGPRDSLGDVDSTAHGVPREPLGDAVVQVDLDAETYERLHAAYCRAVDCGGYPEGFERFVLNHTDASYLVTVDGEPVDPAAADADGVDGGTDSHTDQRR